MLEIKNLSKSYGKKLIIHDFNYTFYPNKIYSITGQTGVGKTTLLKLIAGLENQYQGSIIFNQKNTNEIPNFCKNYIGVIFHDFSLIEELSLIENCFLDLIPSKEQFLYFDKLLNLFKLNNKRNTPCNQLSSGEKQRVCIIRALIKQPKILLCDEPTSHLDDNMKQVFYELLQKIKSETIILNISHDKKMTLQYSDEIITLEKKTNEQPMGSYQVKKYQHLNFKDSCLLYKKSYKTSRRLQKFCLFLIILGLIGLGFGLIIYDFVDYSSISQLENYQTQNTLYFQEKKHSTNDLQKEIVSSYKFRFFQTLDSLVIEKITKEIQNVTLDKVEIKNKTFLLSNQLSTNNCLAISLPNRFQTDFEKDYNNVLEINLNTHKKISITIDYIEFNPFDQYILYCNQVSYLKELCEILNYPFLINRYLYSEQASLLYLDLLFNPNYLNYHFELYQNYIAYKELATTRLSYHEFLEFYDLNKKNIVDYFLADNQHLYIDQNLGTMFLLNIQSLQSISHKITINNQNPIYFKYYDKSLSQNEIIISKKLAKALNLSKSKKITIQYSNKTIQLQIKNILDSSTPEYIFYGNSNFFKNLYSYKSSNLYNGIMILKTNHTKIKKTSNIESKKIKFSIQDIPSIQNLCQMIILFSSIIVIISIICNIQMYWVNYMKKRKNRMVLFNLGFSNKNILHISLIGSILTAIKGLIITIALLLLLCGFLYQTYGFSFKHAPLFLAYLIAILIISLITIVFTSFFYHQKQAN